jgi:hypothetical protein
MHAYEWIQALKRHRNLPSDYAAAKVIGIRQATISNYARAPSSMSPEICAAVADELNIPRAVVILDNAIQRSRSRVEVAALLDAFVSIGGPQVVDSIRKKFH